MAIILEHINDELYFFIKVFLGAAKAMGTAQLRFEIGYGSARVLAALRLNSYVCVRWLTVDTGGKATVLMSGDFNIKEGDGIAFLLFPSELNALMDGIETFIELSSRI